MSVCRRKGCEFYRGQSKGSVRIPRGLEGAFGSRFASATDRGWQRMEE